MHLRRTRHLPWWVRVAVILTVALALALMHALVAGPAMPMHDTQNAHGSHSAPGSAPTMTSESKATDTHMGSGDHCDLGHQCHLVRGDDVPLPPVILVILIWVLAAPPVLAGTWSGAVRLLGRPPPWAVPTHLELAVIRC
ncbi:DUF6153 family protein [Gordonia sp. NPDC003376]